jgi:anti-sigma factor RsiW
MCEGSEKLVAWLDRELPENEAAELDLHVEACAACRTRLDSYRQLDRALDSYCDRAVASSVPPKVPRWVPVLAGVAAAILFLILFRGHAQRPAFQAPSVVQPTVREMIPARVAPKVKKRVQKRPAVATAQSRPVNWVPSDPTIQIAIPAGAMFAPGAVPDGVNLTAEFSIAVDGSAQSLRLRP